MSIHSAKALYTRLLIDEEFRTQLEQAANQQERCQILQVSGFYCTSEELQTAKTDFLELLATNDELSQSDEEQIIDGISQVFMSDHAKQILSTISILDGLNMSIYDS